MSNINLFRNMHNNKMNNKCNLWEMNLSMHPTWMQYKGEKSVNNNLTKGSECYNLPRTGAYTPITTSIGFQNQPPHTNIHLVPTNSEMEQLYLLNRLE
jgi:hypothetical protein